jgi:hypothetical protein
MSGQVPGKRASCCYLAQRHFGHQVRKILDGQPCHSDTSHPLFPGVGLRPLLAVIRGQGALAMAEDPGRSAPAARGPQPGTPAEPHPRAGPGHPREPGADSTAFLDLSATVPAGKGRVRSLNYLHLTQTDRTPAVTVHMRTGTGTGGYPGAGRPRSATRMDRRPPGSPPGGIAGHSQGCHRTWSPLLTGPAGHASVFRFARHSGEHLTGPHRDQGRRPTLGAHARPARAETHTFCVRCG